MEEYIIPAINRDSFVMNEEKIGRIFTYETDGKCCVKEINNTYHRLIFKTCF